MAANTYHANNPAKSAVVLNGPHDTDIIAQTNTQARTSFIIRELHFLKFLL